jgi:hypothetical protein
MRIAFIAQPFDRLDPPVKGGSLAIWIYQVARRCASQGHTVFVIANHGGRFAPTRVEHEGVTYLFTATAANSIVNRGGRAWSALRRRMGVDPRVPEFAEQWCDGVYAVGAARLIRQFGCDAALVMNYSQTHRDVRHRRRLQRVHHAKDRGAFP